MTRSLMVTGGAGFIGVNFVYHWANACLAINLLSWMR